MVWITFYCDTIWLIFHSILPIRIIYLLFCFRFFAASGLIVSFEYTLEETYPIPESVSCSVMNATTFLFAIIFALVAEALFDSVGYLNTFIVTLVLYLCSTLILIFVKSNLRRRDANVASQRWSLNLGVVFGSNLIKIYFLNTSIHIYYLALEIRQFQCASWISRSIAVHQLRLIIEETCNEQLKLVILNNDLFELYHLLRKCVSDSSEHPVR